MKYYFILASLMFFSELAGAATTNKLSDIMAKRSGKDFLIEMEFTNDVSEKDVKLNFVKGTIEVTIPNASPLKKKTFTLVQDQVIDHLYVSQNPDSSLRSRIILSRAYLAKDFEKTTVIMSRANKLFLKISNPNTQVAATENTNELPGDLIDKLMHKEVGEVPQLPGTVTDSAVTAKSNDETQPVFKTEDTSIKEKANPKSQLWLRMLMSLSLVLALIGIAFYAVKKWPGAKKIGAKTRMIEVLSQHHLGAKKSVAVIRVAGEAVLVGITDHNITILKTLELLDDEVPVPVKLPPLPTKKFDNTLAKQIQKEVRKDTEPEEEFSMRGLREIVGDRLRSMKEL